MDLGVSSRGIRTRSVEEGGRVKNWAWCGCRIEVAINSCTRLLGRMKYACGVDILDKRMR